MPTTAPYTHPYPPYTPPIQGELDISSSCSLLLCLQPHTLCSDSREQSLVDSLYTFIVNNHKKVCFTMMSCMPFLNTLRSEILSLLAKNESNNDETDHRALHHQQSPVFALMPPFLNHPSTPLTLPPTDHRALHVPRVRPNAPTWCRVQFPVVPSTRSPDTSTLVEVEWFSGVQRTGQPMRQPVTTGLVVAASTSDCPRALLFG